MNAKLITPLLAALIPLSAVGQGTFGNLGFDSARLIYVDPPNNHTIAATNALPYWAAYSGTDQLNAIPYGLGGVITPVRLYSESTGGGGALSGNYSVVLNFGGSAAPQPGSISQNGLVPSDAESLLFEVGMGIYSGPLTVSLGGQDLSYIAISNAPNFTLYGATIPSTLVGKIATLTFAAGANGASGLAMLDDIQFSSQPIPEPGVLALILLGSGVLLCRRRGFR